MMIGIGGADYSHRYRLQPIPLENNRPDYEYYRYIVQLYLTCCSLCSAAHSIMLRLSRSMATIVL